MFYDDRYLVIYIPPHDAGQARSTSRQRLKLCELVIQHPPSSLRHLHIDDASATGSPWAHNLLDFIFRWCSQGGLNTGRQPADGPLLRVPQERWSLFHYAKRCPEFYGVRYLLIYYAAWRGASQVNVPSMIGVTQTRNPTHYATVLLIV